MSDRYGSDRRQSDRRTGANANYTLPDRRVAADRRKPEKEPRSKLGLAIGALAVFVVADALLWDGQYRRALTSAAQAQASDIRAWSDHVWDGAG